MIDVDDHQFSREYPANTCRISISDRQNGDKLYSFLVLEITYHGRNKCGKSW